MICVSFCTPTLRSCLKSFSCGDYEFLFSSKSGVGAARRELAECSRGELIVMVDDDVSFGPVLTGWLRGLRVGEFAMAVVDGHVSSRVFAIHRSDYVKTGGFDASIQYVFEDGAFYVDALKNGLKFKPIPSNLFVHKSHVNRTGDKRWVKSWFEHSKMLVKYKHHVYPGLVGFFGLRSLLREPQVFFLKVFSVTYWIMKGVKAK